MKSIKRVFPSQEVDMGGIPVLQPFPTAQTEQINPFLLLHHSVISARAGSHPLQAGIGPHPHRGFMPVTYVIEGSLHHRDSLGNSSIIQSGGAQWLNAGKGIVHSERPSCEIAEQGGSVEVVQIWINLPQKAKMTNPEYIGVSHEDIPVKSSGTGLEFGLISGAYESLDPPVKPPFPVFFGVLRSDSEGGKGEISLPEGLSGGMYTIKGSGRVKGYGLVEEKNFYQFDEKEGKLAFKSEGEFLALIMLAEPLQEPLATYGPFVMNSQTEIMEALRDYNQGKMGVLIEE